MATKKITEKTTAQVNEEDQYVLVTQDDNGVHSLRRVPRGVFFRGTLRVDDGGKFFVESEE